MKKSITVKIATVLMLVSFSVSVTHAVTDDFNSVVKMIEQYYNVKHQGLNFLEKTALKAVGVGAKVRGGQYRKYAEAGSIKLAMFEDQTFNGDFVKFRNSLNDSLKNTWSPIVQTTSGENEQNYIFVREKGDKFVVLVISIEQREGTVVQATVAPKALALLMKDPEQGAKALRQEATIDNK